jgi:acetoin utilization protein AcuC
MTVAVVFDPQLARYRFPAGHPLRPERVTLAMALARAWGLLEDSPPAERNSGATAGRPRAVLWPTEEPSDELLALAHTRDYIAAVKEAGEHPLHADPRYGLGDGDTPAFIGMHAASALVAGATNLALSGVVEGRVRRSFSPAGGLHHAHRDRAAGFCVYNDCVVAIAATLQANPGLRVAYVDIDAHHGDGVQEAFYDRDDVLTVSVHESGKYLYPGTGSPRDVGEGAGFGYAVNVALPPFAGPEQYAAVMDEVVAPAVRAYAPDVIVAQLGGDSHHADPLTHLSNTVGGHVALTRAIVALADELCGGRIAATGGGGYEPFSVVPRMWASAIAVLLGVDIPDELPPSWLEESCAAAGWDVPLATRTFDDADPRDDSMREAATDGTRYAIEATRAASVLLGGGA